jgi:hypothetical protein
VFSLDTFFPPLMVVCVRVRAVSLCNLSSLSFPPSLSCSLALSLSRAISGTDGIWLSLPPTGEEWKTTGKFLQALSP